MVARTIRQKIGMEPEYRDRKAMEQEQQALALETAIITSKKEEKAVEEDILVSDNFDSIQIEEACRTQLDFLAAMAMPDTYEYGFSDTHHTAWQILVSVEDDADQAFPQIALGIPRGHAKTTLIKLFILWCVLFSKRRFILVTGAIEQAAINIITDVAKMLEEDNIKAVFGDYRLGLTTDTKSLKKFGYRGRNIVLFGIGSGGAVRGTNVDNQRPDIIVMDDIQTKEGADSPIVSKDLEEWMVGTLMKAKSQRRCMFIFAGNMFAPQYTILKKLKSNPNWIKFISGAILADGSALWPAHRSLYSLIEELNNDIAMGQAHIFFAEVLNDTAAGVNNTVDYSKFPEWPWTDQDLPQGKFLIVDPSQGKGKDADVIVTAEVYDEKVGIRAVHEEHLSPANLIRRTLIIAIKSETYCIAIESMAYQATLLYWFDFICKEMGISGISFVPLYTNSHSKNSRIASGIKAMQTKEVYLHPSIRNMVQNQISNWNPLKRDNTDDILDAIANATKVVAEYSAEILAQSNLMVIEGSGAEVVEDNHAF